MKKSTMTKDYEAQELCFLKKRNADSASLLRPLFFTSEISPIMYLVGSTTRTLAGNQQRNNLQVGLLKAEPRRSVISERGFLFSPDLLSGVGKGDDVKCVPSQHEAKSKRLISTSQPALRNAPVLFRQGTFRRLLKKQATVLCGLSLVVGMTMSWIPSCFAEQAQLSVASNTNLVSKGLSSFYGTEACRFNPSKGCPTASGHSLYSLVEDDIPYAAVWGIPFGTRLKVTNLANHKSVIVIVLDRGPNKRFHPRRVIDLSKSAFKKIASTNKGTIKVEVRKCA